MRLIVITPTLGISPWLEQTIASVEQVGIPNAHVLVAPQRDIGSLAQRFPAVKVVPESSGGMYGAINIGLEAGSEWDAFTYINDDDLLLRDFRLVVDAVARNPRQSLIAYGGVRLINSTGRRLGSIPISPSGELNRALYAQRLEPVYQHGTVITRAVVDSIGGFDASLRYCGDSEFFARACVAGVTFVRATTREVAAFRLRAGQLTKNRAAMLSERARVDQKLGLLKPQPARTLRYARRRFRLANLRIYAERIRRYGIASFDEMLEKLD